MKKILYITDLYYDAKGRNYYEEDLYITGRLKDFFDVALCHPKNTESFENDADLVVFRNAGPVTGFKEEYRRFVERVRSRHLNTFNEFTGKADMEGKEYLLELTRSDYPVIPAVDRKADIHILPDSERYAIKPKDGADSIGLEFLTKDELLARVLPDGEYLIQPAVDFEYEVSFYFINDRLKYAMYAPDKNERWKLVRYDFTPEDADFAKKFIAWNGIKKGIQRVDACRTRDGRLLLMELEDLNPYLSILELDEDTREDFIRDMINTFREMTK